MEKKRYCFSIAFGVSVVFALWLLSGCATFRPPLVVSDESFVRSEVELNEVIRLHDRVREFNAELGAGINRATEYASEARGNLTGAIGALIFALELLDGIETEFYRIESELSRLVSGIPEGGGEEGIAPTDINRVYNPLLNPVGVSD